MKTPDWVLEQIQGCLHSHLARAHEKGFPDYRCTLAMSRKQPITRDGVKCILASEQTCSYREPFLEKFNT